MSSHRNEPQLGSVGQYQMSGIPYATSSFDVNSHSGGGGPTVIEFPNVTNWFYVSNHGTIDIRVSFSELGITGSDGGGTNNYFIIHRRTDSIAPPVFHAKVSRIYLLGDDGAATGDISIFAGLTGIAGEKLITNWSGSIGVG